MQHDLFHVYTVDQHILMVLRNVRRFFIPEHAHEYPFCSQLASQWDKPFVLYVAALFHDVAKGRGGDHSTLGGSEARRFCREHAIEKEDASLIEFLVRHHLTMSHIAQKEDLSDPEVITAFAKTMGDPRRLAALYLLTVADIRGTSPKVWNAWKGKLLEDLYRLTLRVLGGAVPNMDAEIEARKLDARNLLALRSALPGTEKPLWDTLDVSYFARHDAMEIAWHARVLWRHVKTAVPVVSARPSPVGEGLQVLVYSPDRADLFARICGYFDGAGFSIQDAKIHTSRAGYALDTFQVVHPAYDADDAAGYRDLISLIETSLVKALLAEGPLPEPSRGRVSRRVRSFPVTPRVSLRPDERAQRWILSVSASDRSGLLYGIARVLARHHVNLQLAKISTLGERVEDTFLVDGAALQHNREQLEIETELLDAIAPVTIRRRPHRRCGDAARDSGHRGRARLEPLRRGDRRAGTGGVCRGPSARRRELAGARRRAAPRRRHAVREGFTACCAQGGRGDGGAQHRCPRGAMGARQAARVAAAGVLLARRPALGFAGLVPRPDRLSHDTFEWRLQGLSLGGARRARRAAAAPAVHGDCRAHRQRQDAAAARARASRRAGARPRGFGLPPRLGARRLAEPTAAIAKAVRYAAVASPARFDAQRPVFVESESRRVGAVQLPDALVARMREHSRCVRVQMDDAARVQLLLQEYGFFAQQPERFCELLGALTELQGKERVKRWQAMARDALWPELFGELMREHYDPLYERSMQRNFAGLGYLVALALPTAAMTPCVPPRRLMQAGSRWRWPTAAMTPCVPPRTR